jgi:hypothetical protein
MKVGDRVFMFNPNRRIYAEGGKGRPIYREHFYGVEITGETSRSWLVGPKWSPTKINKKTLEGIYTVEQVEEKCWIAENRSELSRRIHSCNDYRKLKQIAEILEGE